MKKVLVLDFGGQYNQLICWWPAASVNAAYTARSNPSA